MTRFCDFVGWLAFVAALGCGCWLWMMAVHEAGHALNAWLSGGRVVGVELGPFEFSRTEVAPNPHPRFVAWGGAAWGVAIPLVAHFLGRWIVRRQVFLATFFAGYCCLANGLYLSVGLVTGAGDVGDLLRAGAAPWQLLIFGLATSAIGLWLWHALGPVSQWGQRDGRPNWRMLVGLTVALVATAAIELAVK